MATNTIPDGIQKMIQRVDERIIMSTKRILQAGRDKIVNQSNFPVVTGRLRLSTIGIPMFTGDTTYGIRGGLHILTVILVAMLNMPEE